MNPKTLRISLKIFSEIFTSKGDGASFCALVWSKWEFDVILDCLFGRGSEMLNCCRLGRDLGERETFNLIRIVQALQYIC